MNTIDELFRQQVARTPLATALLLKNERISYAALNTRANQIAHHLARRKIAREGRVALCMRRSPELVATLLGLSRIGAAYVGVDPSWPLARRIQTLGDSGAQLVIVDDGDRGFGDQLRHGAIVVTVGALFSGEESTKDIAVTTSADQLFSVVYTSGSTGQPKGVMVTVRSVINRLEWMWATYPFRSTDLGCIHRSYTTVGFSWDCFGALLQGVPTLICPVEDTRDVLEVMQNAAENGVTHLAASVGFWKAALDQADRVGGFWPSLRLARTSGEPLPPVLVERWRRGFPHAILLNIYGATECNGSTACDTSAIDLSETTRVPAGVPVPGVEVIVMDKTMRALGSGEVGDIYIGGASLARGYLRQPDLTAERFVPHPRIGPTSGQRLFRTGDRGLWTSDGQLLVVGRSDFQVKVRGFRIELEEVEAAVREYGGVSAAAVEAQGAVDTRLVAYVVTDPESRWSPARLRLFLLDRLPEYMVPAEFVRLRELPLTPSGKVDRTALHKAVVVVSPKESIRAATLADHGTAATPTERLLARTWAEVLGVDVIGVDDDFFEIGGHSLFAAEISARMRDELDVSVRLRTFYANPTVRQMAEVVEAERYYLNLMRQILPNQRISAIDQFWRLGDNETTAVKLTTSAEQHFGTELPFDCLVNSPTPQRMAEVTVEAMRRKERGGTATMVPLSWEGADAPLFLMHPATGDVWWYTSLASALPWNRPIYATRAPDLGMGRAVLGLDEMVTLYLAEIRCVQPKGPYLLAGWSFGGIVAFEVARRLISDGETVRHLILFDTTPPASTRRRASIACQHLIQSTLRVLCNLGWIGQVALWSLRLRTPDARAFACLTPNGSLSEAELRTAVAAAFPAYAREHRLQGLSANELCRVLVDQFRQALPDADWKAITKHVDESEPYALIKSLKVMMKNWMIGRAYHTGFVYPGRITIYATMENSAIDRWQRFCSSQLDVRRVPVVGVRGETPHNSFFLPPNTDLFAHDLKRLLDGGVDRLNPGLPDGS